MLIRCNAKLLLAVAGVAAPSLAFAVFDGGWNVDFNADTNGLPPAITAYDTNAVNTAPQDIDTNAVDTVLVASSFAGLDNQPVVLTNADATTGTNGTTSIPALEFKTIPMPWPENGGAGISVFEWDMSVASVSGVGRSTPDFAIRFQAGASLLFAILMQGVDGDGVGSTSMAYGQGQDKDVTWTLNDPMHVRVELNTSTGRYRIWWDSSFHANELIADRIDGGGLAGFNVVLFRDSGGLGGEIQTFEVAVDNFFSPENVDITSGFTAPDVAGVQFQSVEGATYKLESTTSLVSGIFTQLGATVTGSGGLMTLYDDGTSSSTKPYRISANQ